MLVKVLFALLFMIGLGYSVVGIDRENPVSERFARREVDNLRGFVFSVNRFVGAAHDFEGTVSWEGKGNTTALRPQPSTPSSLRGVSMPSGWRAVIRDGDYLLCAVLSEAALAMMGTDMPAHLHNAVIAAPNGGKAVVFAAPEDFVAGENPAAPAEEWVNTCMS